jgi:hypothetical protein
MNHRKWHMDILVSRTTTKKSLHSQFGSLKDYLKSTASATFTLPFITSSASILNMSYSQRLTALPVSESEVIVDSKDAMVDLEYILGPKLIFQPYEEAKADEFEKNQGPPDVVLKLIDKPGKNSYSGFWIYDRDEDGGKSTPSRYKILRGIIFGHKNKAWNNVCRWKFDTTNKEDSVKVDRIIDWAAEKHDPWLKAMWEDTHRPRKTRIGNKSKLSSGKVKATSAPKHDDNESYTYSEEEYDVSIHHPNFSSILTGGAQEYEEGSTNLPKLLRYR